MTTQTQTPDIPAFPQERSARCPFDPPNHYRDRQDMPGLQQVRLWNGSLGWLVTRYEDVRAALGDPRVSSDGLHPGLPVAAPGLAVTNPDEVPLSRTDDPEHAERRRMLTRWFTVKQVETMRPTSGRSWTTASTR